MPEINTIRCYFVASKREVEIGDVFPASFRFLGMLNVASKALAKLSINSEYKQIS